MENNNTPTRMHPLIAGAAIAVMLVSLTGVAAITGLIPSSYGTSGSTTQQGSNTTSSTAPATVNSLTDSRSFAEKPYETERPTPTPKTSSTATEPNRVRAIPADSQAPQAVAQAPVVCHSCGRVESVRAIQHAAQSSGVGMVAGAVLGGVLGNQVGGGNGRTLATVAGAVGGGYAGNEVEKRSRSTTSYQVRVRMDDGSVRTFPYAQTPGWNVGDRVRVVNGHLTSRA